MIEFRCECGTMLSVPDTAAGKQAKCPECEKVLPIPQKPSAATETKPEQAPPSPPPESAPAEPIPPPSSGGAWGVKTSDEAPKAEPAPKAKAARKTGARRRTTRRRPRKGIGRTRSSRRRQTEDAGEGATVYVEPNPFVIWAKAMFSPTEFFDNIRTSRGIGPPVLFTVLIWSVFGIGGCGAILLLGWSGAVAAGIGVGLIALGLVSVLLGGVWLFIITRLCTGKGTYPGAVRILAYASAPNVIQLIPIVGQLTGIYVIVLYVIGLLKTFRLTGGQVVLVIILGIIVGMVIAGIPAVVIFTSGILELQQ